MRVSFVFLCLLVGVNAYAVLPLAAQKYLNQIPERQLTLPYVLKVAMFNSEAYRIVGYDYATFDLEEMEKFDSITDPFLFADTAYLDDNSAKTNNFQALRAKTFSWNLGLGKNWSSGTETTLSWAYDANRFEFDPNLGAISNSFLTEFKQSAAVLRLEQSLLKNSFGYAFRENRRGARLRGQAIQWKTREDLENVTLELVNQFYQSWLLQQQVASLSDQVKRQARLVKILTRRSKKGAVEKPELIQVEALYASTQARLDGIKAQLSNQWEKLVIDLKLPAEFLGIDPMLVPTAIDNPVPLSLRVCGQKEPKKSALVNQLEKNLEALDATFNAAQNDSLPDLKLVAGYRGNSIDGEASNTFQNVLQGNNDSGFG
ncbi:MAG: hypothetical protein AAF203_04340, partial [Pseudomonadota bacterium]